MPASAQKATATLQSAAESIAGRIAEALAGPVPTKCPFSDSIPAGISLSDIPEEARKLAPLWAELKDVADRVAHIGNDGGVWMRRHQEAETVMQLIYNSIRAHHGIQNMRIYFHLYSGWKYSQHGG